VFLPAGIAGLQDSLRALSPRNVVQRRSDRCQQSESMLKQKTAKNDPEKLWMSSPEVREEWGG
jgi:hypothetical protein